MKTFFKKLKRITAYTWALIALVVIYFATGMTTLGTTQTTGGSFYLEKNKEAYFYVSAGGEKFELDDVYVNVGLMYGSEAGTASVTVSYYTNTNEPTSTTTNWKELSKVKVGNVYSAGLNVEVPGSNFNWAPLAVDKQVRNRSYISIKSDVSMDINEIVCLNAKGEQLTIKPFTKLGKYTQNDLLGACDAQHTFTLDESFKYNFTQEETHYLASALTVKGGSFVRNGATYNFDPHYNFLGTLLFVPSISMFGVNTFALRLPAFLASCVLLVFAALFMRELTKSKKVSFIFATVLALGGVLTTVGKVASPFMFVASALVASLYFMYRFFSRGISSKKVVKGGMNVLASGLFAAVAMSIDLAACVFVFGILVLFACGLRRQKAAYALELKKTEGMDEKVTLKNGETKVVNKEARKAEAKYGEKKRICLGFATLSFVAATAFILLFSSLFGYSAYAKARGENEVNFLSMIFNQSIGSLRGFVRTEFSKANASNVLAWWLPLKPATLSSGVAGGKYLAFSVLPNMVAILAAFASFVYVMVKVVKGIVKKEEDKATRRLRRGAIVLFGGMLCAMLAATLRAGVTAEMSLLFHVCYLGFIGLAITQFDGCKYGKFAIWAMVGLVVVNFVICLPALYGFAAPTGWAKAFGWTAWINNGIFR
ncbi:MAG: hypothetical protein E7352_05125 [Clostridiales bacterium]|nr:hypothetical protein [Clostridiales bacterium]